MTLFGLALVVVTALITATGNMILRVGLRRAGGFVPTEGDLIGSLIRVFTEPVVLGGLTLYVLAATMWFWIQSTQRLGTSYVLLVASTFTAVTLGSVVFFDEPLGALKVAGIVIILAGMALVALT